MRLSVAMLAAWCALALPAVRGQQPASSTAASVLAAAREALGGEKRLSAVKSFTATGRTRQVRGENLVPIEFEIFCELPDRYARRDEIPAQESGPTTTGFSGEELIQLPVPDTPPAREGAPTPPAAQLEAARKARLSGVKQDFVRLTLGMFAASFPSHPLTFSYVGQAEAPQGKAEVLEGKGPDNFTVRLFVDSATHLPIMVSWQPPTPVRGRGAAGPPAAPAGRTPTSGATPPQPAGTPPPAPSAPSPPPDKTTPPAASKPPESRLYFADYRNVDGLQLPFRIRRAVGADTVEETTFDRFRINAKIDPRRFEVRK